MLFTITSTDERVAPQRVCIFPDTRSLPANASRFFMYVVSCSDTHKEPFPIQPWDILSSKLGPSRYHFIIPIDLNFFVDVRWAPRSSLRFLLGNMFNDLRPPRAQGWGWQMKPSVTLAEAGPRGWALHIIRPTFLGTVTETTGFPQQDSAPDHKARSDRS